MSNMKHGMLAYSGQDVQTIESWLGAQIDLVTTTWSEGQWGIGAITWGAADKAASLERVFGQTDRQLVTHFEMAGNEGKNGDYTTAANGGFDDRYRQTAKELVDLGMTDTIIRPSAEFNLSWSGDYPNDPDNYASAFARVVREMNSVDGTNFTYLYSPARNKIGVADECWPLDAPEWSDDADTPPIAPSFYDDSWYYEDKAGSEITDQDRVNAWQSERDKLDTWQQFADDRQSPGLCSPEWGLVGLDEVHPGGGDNPYFIEKAIEYMEANDWLFQTYWNDGNKHSSGHTKELLEGDGSTDNPKAKAKFKEMVALGDDGSTPVESDPEPTTSYGGYNMPEAGTANWHVPLNENFSSIEADIEDIADRISKIEENN